MCLKLGRGEGRDLSPFVKTLNLDPASDEASAAASSSTLCQKWPKIGQDLLTPSLFWGHLIERFQLFWGHLIERFQLSWTGHWGRVVVLE